MRIVSTLFVLLYALYIASNTVRSTGKMLIFNFYFQQIQCVIFKKRTGASSACSCLIDVLSRVFTSEAVTELHRLGTYSVRYG